jgi:hypothetical protein
MLRLLWAMNSVWGPQPLVEVDQGDRDRGTFSTG